MLLVLSGCSEQQAETASPIPEQAQYVTTENIKPEANQVESKKETQAISDNNTEANGFRWTKEEVNTAVETSKKAGVIHSLDTAACKVYVTAQGWSVIDAPQKEMFAQILSEFFGYRSEIVAPRSLKIIDSQSGRELASYSTFSGFKAN
jgi:di/tripeptidase